MTSHCSDPQPDEAVPFLSSEMSHPASTSIPDLDTPDDPTCQFEVSDGPEDDGKASNIMRRFYVSHFLSTWNSRVFEFGAILIIAQIYEGTLLPTSVYALVRAASAIMFAPTIGRHVDQVDRLKVVRLSIIGQRLAVISSCLGLWLLSFVSSPKTAASLVLFGIMTILACVEKLCSIMNLIAIERDWVVVVAKSSNCGLEVLNSQMRRIDLICKLLGPLVIALVDAQSLRLTVSVLSGTNAVSLAIEYFAIEGVYRMVPALRSKQATTDTEERNALMNLETPVYWKLPAICIAQVRSIYRALSDYSRHAVFLPSLALCLLYLTVLSFSGQMITYLISVGVTSTQIGLLRTVSTAVEISATWLAPIAMDKIGTLRSGLWFINWQLICICGSVGAFWLITRPLLGASILIVGMIASRVGLWGFDLCVQIIVQEVLLHVSISSLCTNPYDREWKLNLEDLSLLSSPLFKISSNSAHSLPPSSLRVPINTNIQY